MTNKEAKEIMSKVTFYWELGEQTLTQNQINEAIDLAIKALGQQPCEDCISRKAVKEQMIKYGFKAPDMTVTEFVEDCLPSVTPTRPTGRWERRFVDYKKCSICGEIVKYYHDYKYCPYCGARMAESEDKESEQ